MAIYCCSDLHGQSKLFNQILDYIKPEDTVYFLGDAMDRGPDGWEICKAILDDSRFIYLKGNHEDLLFKAIRTIDTLPFAGLKDNNAYDFYNRHMTLWFYNGGEVTYEAMTKDDDVYKYFQRLKGLPIMMIYVNKHKDLIYLSHAGFDPDQFFRGEYTPDEEDLLWDRKHFINDAWYGADNEFVIHGHTPNSYLVKDINHFKKWHDDNNFYEYKEGSFWYANGHKCCIDCGAHFTNMTTLLNLDTFEEKIFKINE